MPAAVRLCRAVTEERALLTQGGMKGRPARWGTRVQEWCLGELNLGWQCGD